MVGCMDRDRGWNHSADDDDEGDDGDDDNG